MADSEQQLTKLGHLLEDAREALDLSKRAAATRAGISEGRWRQVVSGQQRQGSIMVRSRPRRATVIAMAKAVGVDPDEALRTAGFALLPAVDSRQEDGSQSGDAEPSPDHLRAWVEAMIDEIWDRDRHPSLNDSERQVLMEQLQSRLSGIMAIAERLKRTA